MKLARASAVSTSLVWMVLCVAILRADWGVQDASADTLVQNTSQLVNAVNAANASGGNTTILLADGTYTLSALLPITASHITVRSQSGNRNAVVIQGDAMSASASVKEIFWVDADYFTLQDVTLQRVGWHLVQIVGEDDVDYAVMRNCILRDAYEQLVKITQSVSNPNVTGDNGLIENSLFEYSAGIGPQYYIGGIDLHGGSNWTIRGNTFRDIISPDTTTAEHAIHIWDAPASNSLVERNLIVNCDRGIGFGLGDRGHSGGIIRNNMVYHAAGNGSFADVPISLESSPGTQVYGNTVYLAGSYPNAIEYRFAATTGVTIRNNLTNRIIQSRDGAVATVGNNLTNAASAWFVDTAQANLHLASGVTAANNAGIAIVGLADDFDGDARPQGGGIDIGADEYAIIGPDITPPTPPTGLGVE